MDSTSYEFGPYRLDASARTLYRDREIVPLPLKAIEVLLLLVQHHGEIVAKDLFFETVWPGSFVEESNLTQSVFVLRKTLADGNGAQSYIETIPKRGYRFVAPVRTPSLIQPPELPPLPPPHTSGNRRHFLWLGLAGGVGFAALAASRLRTAPALPIQQTVALSVLPFKNLSGDKGQDYLADGLTDSLTGELGKVRGLRVRSRTSAMRHKDSPKTVREIATELGVTALVEGSIARSGNRVHVVCQLIDTTEDSHLWSENYDRPIQDLPILLSEIAGQITKVIRVRVSADEHRRLAKRGSPHPDAFEAYLKGRYLLESSTPDSVTAALDQFKTALRADPAYAPAYVGLAECYLQLGAVHIAIYRPREARALTIGAARQALAIDPDLAEAHAVLAHACMLDWDWDEAEKALRRALELNPSSVPTRILNARYLAATRHFDQAVQEVKLAIELDPLTRSTRTHLASTFMYARRFDEGIEEAQRLIQSDPSRKGGYWQMGLIYLNSGRPHLAIPPLERCAQFSNRHFTDLGFLAQAYGAAGRTAEAVAILNHLLALQRQTYVTPCLLALIQLSLKIAAASSSGTKKPTKNAPTACCGPRSRPSMTRCATTPASRKSNPSSSTAIAPPPDSRRSFLAANFLYIVDCS